MMFFLEISKAGDAAFAVVFCGVLVALIGLMIVYGLLFESAPEYFKGRRERRRRNKNRKGYVYIEHDRRYK